MISRLQHSIEALYSVFSKYAVNNNMEGSPIYGDLSDWNKALFSTPLRKLEDEDLCRFTGKAMTTWGEAEDYKHFLPRILELTAIYKTPYEIWVAFDKLDHADWKNWNKEEQDVVNEFMIALFENLLNDHSEKAQSNFMDYYSAINHFCSYSDTLISIWENVKTKASIIHLSKLIIDQYYMIFNKGVLNGFNKSRKNMDQLTEWLLSNKTIEILETAYFQYQSEEFSKNISDAELILSNEQNRNTVKNINLR